MEDKRLEQEFENKRLQQTLSLAQAQLQAAELRNKEKQADVIAAKKELRENSSHSISNLWSSDNFHDLVELSQYALPVSDQVALIEQEATRILALKKMLDSPYFARIDFRFDGENYPEMIYIGHSSLMDEQTHEMYVYDWRSPIASVFYRFGTGDAFYDSPGGRITGEVTLKRQYEIKKGKLEYFFDADVEIIDNFLRRILSQNTSAKMKAIVETIQKDQDLVIRDLETDLLMVQGAAGSGKTSVALHRAAYLMYQGLSARLSANDIVILSPNTIFEQYISSVLPELGESNVNSILFEELLSRVLQKKPLQTKNQYLESILAADDTAGRRLEKKSMEFKGSSQFAAILRRFIQDIPRKWIDFSDIYYDGKIVASRQLLKAKVLQGNTAPLLSLRLKELESFLLEKIHRLRKTRLQKLTDFVKEQPEHVYETEEVARMLSIQESTTLIKSIRRFTEIDCLELYKKLFSNEQYFYRLAKGLQLPDDIAEIIKFTQASLEKDVLSYADALALTFLHLQTQEFNQYSRIKQVVIDEAQDYYPLHFEILHALFPNARYTVLGDINQTMGKEEDMTLYEQIRKILAKKTAALVTLDKSFRSTNEILKFSEQFLSPGCKHNSIGRTGEPPAVHSAGSQTALLDLIISEIRTCRESNYQSIGLLCKNAQDARNLYRQLKDLLAIQLITDDADVDLQGVFVIPVYLSKGLEFDAVLICDVDKEHYHSQEDKKLLYIACTRALHRLNLFYSGEISPLLLHSSVREEKSCSHNR